MNVAVYLCESKGHISDTVDFEDLKQFLRGLEDVSIVKSHELLCGGDGKEMLEEDLEKKEFDRLVIGGGSPKEKRSGYDDILEEHGFNPFLMQMVNLREQCSWVTEDEEEATEKAKALMKAGVNRVKKMEALDKESIEAETDVLVFGGSIAAIEAARTLSEAGRKVFLATESSSLGGTTVQKEFLYPEDQCAPCMVAPKTEEIEHDDNIEVLSLTEVEEVLGSPGNFQVKIKKNPRYVDPEKCIPCGKCSEACPVTVENEFDYGLSERAAIYKLFPGAVPNSYFIDTENCLRFNGEPCTKCAEACPMDAVEYDQEVERKEIDVGSIIVGPKARPYDADKVFPEVRDKDLDVYTNMEFERFLSEAGPTEGEIVTKSGEKPDSVAIVHCVGSRCKEHLNYCSGTCCMDSLKIARAIKDELESCEVHEIYDDLVLPDKGFDDYAQDTEEDKGVNLMEWEMDGELVDLEEGENGIVVTGEDTDGRSKKLEVDMVILSVGWQPPENTERIAEEFGLETGEYGFVDLKKPVESPTEASEGEYAAGMIQDPMDTFESMTLGNESAGEILAKIVPGRKIELEPQRAEVNSEKCIGCQICIETCPYNAISKNEEKGVAEVDRTLCEGCGACVAACPTGAMQQKNFTSEEVESEVEGLVK